MAEVKRVSGPMKPPSFNTSSSSTYKHIYDDIFASPAQSRQISSAFVDDEYAEMFGSSRSNNGSWSISYSSVPVLDLPPPSEIRVRGGSGVTTISGETGGEVDYGGVFGGGSGGSGCFGLPDGEELFCMFEKRAKTSSNGIPRNKGQTAGSSKPVILKQSQEGQSPTNGFCQSFDGLEHLEQKTNEVEQKNNEVLTKRSDEFKKEVRARDIPRSAQKSLSSKSCEFRKATEWKHLEQNELLTRRSGELMKVARAHDIPGSAQKSLSSKSCEFMKAADEKHLEQKNNEVLTKCSGELMKAACDHDVSGSNSADESCLAWKSSSSKSCMTRDDPQMDEDVNLAKVRENHSRRTVSDLGANVPKSEGDGGFLNASGFHGSVSADTSPMQQTRSRNDSSDVSRAQSKINVDQPAKQGQQLRHTTSDLGADQQNTPSDGVGAACNLNGLSSVDTSQETEAGPSKAAVNDVNIDNGFVVKRKKGKHSRITSLDLGGQKHSCEFDGGLQRKPRFGSSYSFDASHDPCTARIKVQPSMMAPSSSVPQFFPVESHYKISENSSFTNFETNLHRSAGGSPPSLAEQLDVNSAAAVSAAALQKAIEEAATTIRLAKEFLERESQGSGELRFKDTLKLTVSSDDQLADEMDKFQQTKMYETFPPTGSEMRTYSSPQRDIKMEDIQPTSFFDSQKKLVKDDPVFEDQEKFVQDEERLEMKNANVSELIDESDRRERMGEWEAAKQLNQLISGVKNRIASFMAWQTDTEKKEEPKKTGTDVKSHQEPVEHEPDKTGFGTLKASRIEKDRDGTTCVSETPNGESKIRIASEIVEPNVPESISRKSVELEKAENGAACNSNVTESTSTSFEFFAFRNGRLCDPSDPHPPEEEKSSFQESKELDVDETVDRQVLNEVKYEHFQGRPEDQDGEGLDDACTTDDNARQDDAIYFSGDSSNKEFNDIVEEPHSLVGQDREEANHEKGSDRTQDVEWRKEPIVDSCYVGSSTEKYVENGGCEESEVVRKAENWQDNVEVLQETNVGAVVDESVEATEGIYVYQQIEGEQSKTDAIEEATDKLLYCGEIKTDESVTDHIEEIEEEVAERESCIEEAEDVSKQTEYIYEATVKDVSEETSFSAAVENDNKHIHTDVIEEIEEEVAVRARCIEEAEDVSKQTEYIYEATVEDVSEETSFSRAAEDDHKHIHTDVIEEIEEIEEEVAEKASCIEEAEDISKQTEYFYEATMEDVSEESFSASAEDDDKHTHTDIIEEIEEIEQEVAERASCIEEAEDVPEQTEYFYEATVEDVSEETNFSAAAEDDHKHIHTDIIEEIEEIEEEVAERASCIERAFVEDVSEEISFSAAAEDDHKHIHTEHIEEIADMVEQVTCSSAAEDAGKQTEDVFLRKPEEPCRNDSSSGIEDVSSDEENDKMMDIPNDPSEFVLESENQISIQKVSELIEKEVVLPYEKTKGTVSAERVHVANESFQFESMSLHNDESNVRYGKKENGVRVMESKSQDTLEDEADHVCESGEKLNSGEIDVVGDQDSGKGGAEAVHRRRRWFENGAKVRVSERPNIVEGDRVELDIEPEVLDESDFAGGVEVHADKPDSNRPDFKVCEDAATDVNQGNSSYNIEATPKRRRWQIKRGEEGLPEPPPLFQGVKVSLEEPRKNIHKIISHSVSDSSLDKLNAESGESLSAGDADVATNGESVNHTVERAPRRKRWFESGQTAGPVPQLRSNGDAGITVEIDQESKVKANVEDDKADSIPKASGIAIKAQEKLELVNERHADEVNKREKEKEKERVAVERVIREARERAFADAKERARREAMERPNVEARQRAPAGPQERLGKVSAEGRSSVDKASAEAKLRVERAAVERATAEARERALQRALYEKLSHRSREQAGKFPAEKSSSSDPNFKSSSTYSRGDLLDEVDGVETESAQRHKARLERQSRSMERAAKALEEKNTRDLLAQKEQAAKNMLADSLDSEVKRWSTGKEGNVRALLSTLQYILGPDSGWQAVSLTDLIAATAVRKAYKKATLCVHPDKLQQRGATIQQKYICEKVFDLLKEAWSKFNPDER